MKKISVNLNYESHSSSKSHFYPGNQTLGSLRHRLYLVFSNEANRVCARRPPGPAPAVHCVAGNAQAPRGVGPQERGQGTTKLEPMY